MQERKCDKITLHGSAVIKMLTGWYFIKNILNILELWGCLICVHLSFLGTFALVICVECYPNFPSQKINIIKVKK